MIPLHDDNPTEITPMVTIALIVLCSLVFLYEVSLPEKVGEAFVFQYGAIPASIFGHESDLPEDAVGFPITLTLLTSMFLHAGWMHLIGNMLYLWIFGNNIEDVMGHVKFVIFYVVCGIFAAMSHALTDPSSAIPMVGASGAISGVLGAYLLLFPRAQVLVVIPLGIFMRTMYVPAGFVLGFWFVLQLLSGGISMGQGGGGVAWFAHVGGFVAGMALIGLFKRPDVRFFAPARHRGWHSSDW
ncbi:MAG: rhomboid family intramembrane serine protease [Nitrospirae bacterium RIFCSPLOWO2_02_FULL_62_14]|nr:MAG: rhomboid family intramembrane serine protease [Nitrospirae bacterium RIFCSPLOWO2_02_FULL_62_14]